MIEQNSLLGDLEAAIQSGSSERRTQMLRRVTDLFIVTAPSVTPQQAGVFDDVFEQLIREIEWKAVVELSDRVAPLDNAPDRLIRRLAQDDSIEISGPVLAQSPRLGEDDLVAIARTKSQAHLAAIAGRAEIGEQVTDVLVERGDMVVARKVAANNGARFSEGSLRSLVGRATDDSDLASAVARRRELPAPMFRDLLTRATDAVRERLLESALPNTQAVVNRILSEVSQGVADNVSRKRDYRAAESLVAEMSRKGNFVAEKLYQLAKSGNLEEVVVALSALTHIPVEVIDRLLDDATDDPLLVVCKSIDLDWGTVQVLLGAWRGAGDMPEGHIEAAERKYRKLATSSAQRVIRFWQAREKLAG
jgi:uncharacterized protein (DUF2336 family)